MTFFHDYLYVELWKNFDGAAYHPSNTSRHANFPPYRKILATSLSICYIQTWCCPNGSWKSYCEAYHLQDHSSVDDKQCSTSHQNYAEVANKVVLKSNDINSELTMKSIRKPVPRPNPECCNHDCYPESDAPDGKCCWHRCGRVPWPWQESFSTWILFYII